MEDIAYLLSKELVWGEILARHARKIPNKTALVSEGKTFTYREFNVRVNRLAHAFMAEGIKRGDKVAFVLYNSNEILECYFAAPKFSPMPKTSPPTIAPVTLPNPPRATTMNALVIGVNPMLEPTSAVGATRTPPSAARA